ncbi:hypothetical protein Pan216_31140 [Planctomycetes bacterium Pan216]|uniref:DUF4350 domain-containing protein n=1 Tax=Kolteria novifilia TaxID=2527975 RepID=A0A518B5J9_9BACT|nr:hypothetical protein Pan216_31140 [Planctomycetes bacterium Pan216]
MAHPIKLTGLTFLAGLLLLGSAGCESHLDTSYGSVHGASINGIRGFAELLRQQGHRVGFSYRLTPRLMEREDVLVYFDPSGGRLDGATRLWFEEWLEVRDDRHLIIVPRDSDTEIAYWDALLALPPGSLDEDQIDEATQRRRSAEDRQRSLFSEAVELESADWYGWRLAPTAEERIVRTVTGEPSWTDDLGLEQGELDLRFRRRLEVSPWSIPLVTSGDDTVISELPLAGGSVWIVGNGSFLLNFGLVNREHRKLAGALGEAIGSGKRVTFVLGTRQGEAEEQSPGLLSFLRVFPLSWVGMHLIALGLIYGLYQLPIFGRPKVVEQREVYRFGRHVAALGALLESTGKGEFARKRVAEYRQKHQGDSVAEAQEKE